MAVDLSGAINEAIASAKDEAGVVDEKPAAETSAEETPAETEAAPEAEAEEAPEPEPAEEEADDEPLLNPTAEELAAIEADPKLQKVYKSLQRGLTKKATEFKAAQKALKDKSELVDWMQANPDKAAEALAEARGFKLSRAEQKEVKNEVVDALEAEYAEKVGPEAAKLLRPLIEKTAKNAIDSVIKEQIEPLKVQAAQVERAAQERGIAAAVSSFESKVRAAGGEWDDDVQAEMAARINRLEPGKDVSIDEYLDDIYDATMSARLRLKGAKQTRDRLRRIASESEPVTPARTPAAKEERVTSDMKDKDAIALAVKIARQETAAARR